ncbi:MAG: phosphatidylglycerophosphatase A [Pseudomonadota bacterium]|nr:phosphatidylglycerophosphatase A [Pseudomonadota bacterium]
MNSMHWLGFGFGLGLMPAPGTCGSLLGLLPALFFHDASWVSIGSLLAGIIVSWRACWFAYHMVGGFDHKAIVIDEILGMWIALYFVPVSIFNYIIVFGLFRFFDIVKPVPVSWFESPSLGYHGVMLDDCVAGLLANLTWHVLYYLMV